MQIFPRLTSPPLIIKIMLIVKKPGIIMLSALVKLANEFPGNILTTVFIIIIKSHNTKI